MASISADALKRYVSVDPDRLGGEPVFAGTRVPVRSFFDHVRAGDTIDTFLDDFPGVTREQALAVLDRAEDDLLRELHAP